VKIFPSHTEEESCFVKSDGQSDGSQGSCILWTGVISLATLIMLMYMRMIKSSAESGYFPEWHHQRFYNLQQIRPGQLDRQVSHPVTSPSKKKKLVNFLKFFLLSLSSKHIWLGI
jgi:hypothetical protein